MFSSLHLKIMYGKGSLLKAKHTVLLIFYVLCRHKFQCLYYKFFKVNTRCQPQNCNEAVKTSLSFKVLSLVRNPFDFC